MLERLRGSLLSIVGALAIGAVIIALLGRSPLMAYYAVLQGAFGSLQGFMQVLAYTTPLLFTGLAVALAFRSGVFNVGGEGQLYVGGLAAALVGIYVKGSWPLPLLMGLLAGGIAGAIWALLPGIAVGRTPASLVVATIMMNTIGVLLADYLVRYYFLSPWATGVETADIGSGALLPRFSTDSQLTWGVVIALLLVIIVNYLLYQTTLGFSFRAVGQNVEAARFAGIPIFRNTLIALTMSGAMCGLGGAVMILGVYGRFLSGFSPNYGWDGITVAILAGNSPLGVVLSAALFGMLRAASISMTFKKSIPVDMITVLQGLIVCFVAAPRLWNSLRSLVRRERR